MKNNESVLENLKKIKSKIDGLIGNSQSIVSKQHNLLLSSLSSFLDIEQDGYSIINDFIQLYNGDYLKCPSLTIIGTFIKSEESECIYDFFDIKMNHRGILKKIGNFVELTIESGNWIYFKTLNKLRILGKIDKNNSIQWNKDIICGIGKNEKKQDCELFVKNYSQLLETNLNNDNMFVLSFLCRHCHILQIS
jgi:hypothetical protein